MQGAPDSVTLQRTFLALQHWQAFGARRLAARWTFSPTRATGADSFLGKIPDMIRSVIVMPQPGPRDAGLKAF